MDKLALARTMKELTLQQEVGKYAQTFLDYPPMQKGASFNLEAVKQELDRKMASHAAQ